MELGHDCVRVAWTKLGPAGLQLLKHRRVHRCLNLLREMFGDPLPQRGAGQCWRGQPRCLADPSRGWPCWDLNCPCTACGGVWSAQCLNSLMTALGRCPPLTPARPRPPVTSPRAGNDGAGGVGQLQNRSRARRQRGIACSSGCQWGLAKGRNDGRAGIRAVKVKHPPGLFSGTHLSGLKP